VASKRSDEIHETAAPVSTRTSVTALPKGMVKVGNPGVNVDGEVGEGMDMAFTLLVVSAEDGRLSDGGGGECVAVLVLRRVRGSLLGLYSG